MLLDEDPATLIRECITNFNIAPDRASLTRITSSLSTLSQARDLRLHEARASLKKVERTLASLSQQHDLSLSAHNPTEHASSILALDAQKFKVAKEASDAEVEKERLELEVAGLEGQMRELQDGQAQSRATSQEEQKTLDQAILKLKLYRSLGIDVDMDSAGRYSRAMLRNTRKGDVHLVEFDPGVSISRHADELWSAL